MLRWTVSLKVLSNPGLDQASNSKGAWGRSFAHFRPVTVPLRLPTLSRAWVGSDEDRF
jgi:hypothetical protein